MIIINAYFHLWAWNWGSHFEPLWHPWSGFPHVHALSQHAAALMIEAAIPHEAAPPVPGIHANTSDSPIVIDEDLDIADDEEV